MGPIRLGMSTDQIRAALPGATWTDRGPEHISAMRALKIGGEEFDIVYTDYGWDRYRMTVRRHDPGPVSADDCRARIVRFLETIENANGALTAPAPLPKFNGAQEPMRIGRSSQALSRAAADQSVEIAVERTQRFASLKARGTMTTSKNGAADCVLEALFEQEPPRPPQGVIAFEALEIAPMPTIGVIHHSLDAAPPPPPQGVDVPLSCTIGGVLNCREGAGVPNAVRPFVGAAIARTAKMRVPRRLRDGRWTTGELTMPRIRIMPGDRRTVGPIDVSKSSLLRWIGEPRFGMPKIADHLPDGFVAKVSARCVVQTDGSLICPEIVALTEPHAEEFRAAALSSLLNLQSEPRLTNGEPSAGTGYNIEIEYRVN